MTVLDVLCQRLRSVGSLAWPRGTSACRTQVLHALLVLGLLSWQLQVARAGTCRNTFRCLNGGTERYSVSILGPCRCMCPDGYTGPRCQYQEVARKRSSSLNVLNDFLQRRLRQEQERAREEEEAARRQQDAQEEEEEAAAMRLVAEAVLEAQEGDDQMAAVTAERAAVPEVLQFQEDSDVLPERQRTKRSRLLHHRFFRK